MVNGVFSVVKLYGVISFLEQEEPYQDLWIPMGRGEGATLTAAHAAAAAGSPSALGWFGGGRRVCEVWNGGGCRGGLSYGCLAGRVKY